MTTEDAASRLQTSAASVASLQTRLAHIDDLPTEWNQIKVWTSDHLDALRALLETTGTRAAQAALLARLFWEAKTSARRFATTPSELQLFVDGMIPDGLDICASFEILAEYVQPSLSADLRAALPGVRAPLLAASAGKPPKKWPFGKRLATTPEEQRGYDALALVCNKFLHATPFFVLAPPAREQPIHIWFLASLALENAGEVVRVLEDVQAGGHSLSPGTGDDSSAR